MKVLFSTLIALAAPSMAMSQTVTLPDSVALFCGIKFAPTSVDPHSIEVNPESGEGDTEIDSNQVVAPGVRNGNILTYQVKGEKMFVQGAPSYSFDLALTLDLSKYVPGDKDSSAIIRDAIFSYRVKGPKGNVVGQGQVPGVNALVMDFANGMTGFHYHNNSGKNAVFYTGSRNGIFNCSFQH